MAIAKKILSESQFTAQTNELKNIPESAHLFSQIHLRHKLKLTQNLLEKYTENSVIIFCSRKRDKFLLQKYLLKSGIQAHFVEANKNTPLPSLVISSDDCPYQAYKNEFSGLIHFDIPQTLSSYSNRIQILGNNDNNITHAIVTQREASMMDNFNTELGIDAESETIPGFEEDIRF